MSKLDEAMQKHMEYLVYSVERPFCYKDFLYFKINGETYGMKHTTYRNKISELKKKGKVELDYNSVYAFYTLKGNKFGRPMTSDHTVVNQYNPLIFMLQNLPLEKQSIHDIRLKFKVSDIWKILSLRPEFYKNKRSNDIIIPAWHNRNTIVKIIIHKTDTVSVIVGCSLEPILLDVYGIIRFFTNLTRVEERLKYILKDCNPVNYNIHSSPIPEYLSWIVTMWHFGRDGLPGFNGERFHITVKDAQDVLIRLYTKDFNGKLRLRLERQECPNISLADAIKEKIFQK